MDWVKISDAARIIGCSRQNIQQRLLAGNISGKKINELWHVLVGEGKLLYDPAHIVTAKEELNSEGEESESVSPCITENLKLQTECLQTMLQVLQEGRGTSENRKMSSSEAVELQLARIARTLERIEQKLPSSKTSTVSPEVEKSKILKKSAEEVTTTGKVEWRLPYSF